MRLFASPDDQFRAQPVKLGDGIQAPTSSVAIGLTCDSRDF